MEEKQNLHYFWELKRTASDLGLLVPFILLSDVYFIFPLIGICIYLYSVKFRKKETEHIMISNEYVRYWFNECDKKKTKIYPALFLKNAFVENREEVFEFPYDYIENIRVDRSRTRIILDMKNKKAVFFDIKGEPANKLDEIYNELYTRWNDKQSL